MTRPFLTVDEALLMLLAAGLRWAALNLAPARAGVKPWRLGTIVVFSPAEQ